MAFEAPLKTTDLPDELLDKLVAAGDSALQALYDKGLLSQEALEDIKGRKAMNTTTTLDDTAIKIASKRQKKITPPKKSTAVVDLTTKFKGDTGITKAYGSPSEQNLAKYAVTEFVNRYGQVVRDSRNIANPPSNHTIKTDVRTVTQVFRDVTATVLIPYDGKEVRGVIQAIQVDDAYRISMSGAERDDVDVLESTYSSILETTNFYQGKSLRFADDGVEFIPTPNTIMEEVVLPADTLKEYQLNVVDFLTVPEMHLITKKRGIILHGAPGTGKTSSVKAFFNILFRRHITCIYISDASFSRFSVEQVFSFINTYLAPCLVVFEDIDLVAMDRRMGGSKIIGPLLSAMNGIEETVKPIVILATTNRPEVLDAAVTRPCRFDRKIKVDYPTVQELERIFQKVAGFAAPKGMFIQPEKTEMRLTGAHVEEIYRTAALTALSTKRTAKECVVEAYETVSKHFMLVSPKIVRGFDGDDDGNEQHHYRGTDKSPSGGDVFR
jgi:hypothetical protein